MSRTEKNLIFLFTPFTLLALHHPSPLPLFTLHPLQFSTKNTATADGAVSPPVCEHPCDSHMTAVPRTSGFLSDVQMHPMSELHDVAYIC